MIWRIARSLHVDLYIHSRALFRVACSRSPLSKGSIFLQPAQDTAREQVTFYLTSSDIARGSLHVDLYICFV